MSYADDMSKEQLLSASAIDRYVMEEEEEEASNPEEHEKEKEKSEEEQEEKEKEGLENEIGNANVLELEAKSDEDLKVVPNVQEKESEPKKEMEKSVNEMNPFSFSGVGLEKPVLKEEPKMDSWNKEKENVNESAKMEEEEEEEVRGVENEELPMNENENENRVAHNEIASVQETKNTQIVENGIEMDGHMNVEDSSILHNETEHVNAENQIEKEARNDENGENEGVFRFSEVLGGDDLSALDNNGELPGQQLEEV